MLAVEEKGSGRDFYLDRGFIVNMVIHALCHSPLLSTLLGTLIDLSTPDIYGSATTVEETNTVRPLSQVPAVRNIKSRNIASRVCHSRICIPLPL